MKPGDRVTVTVYGEERAGTVKHSAHVVMRHKGKELLGEVRRAYRDSAGYWRLDVRHFNGEAWPVAPNVGAVEVLERTYTDGDV